MIAVGHLKELFYAFFANGEKWDIKITYSYENKPLGTAAPLKLIDKLDDNFIVMNGDVLTNLNFHEFFKYHIKSKASCTIAMFKKPIKIDLGILKTDKTLKINDYIEKPTLNYNVSMGIYAFRKNVLNFIPKNEYFDFPDLILKLLENKKEIIGFPFNGYWLDIGRPEDYKQASVEFEKNITLFLK